MKKLLIVALLALCSFNATAYEVKGSLFASLEEGGLKVGPKVYLEHKDLFCEISVLSLVDSKEDLSVEFAPDSIEFNTVIGFKLKENFTMEFKKTTVR